VKKKWAPHIPFLLFLSAPIILFHWKILGLGHIICGGDMVHCFVPWREFAVNEIRQGRFPLWNPFTFCGNPFTANIQTSLFYPLNLFNLFFSPEREISLSLVIHQWIAAGGMYLFLHRLWGSKPGAAFGAAVYVWSGFFITHADGGHLIHLRACAFIPLALYAQTTWRNGITPLNFLFFSLTLSGMFYAGHTQIPLYVFYLLLGRAIGWSAWEWKSGKPIAVFFRYPLWTTGGLMLSLFLSATVLLPLLELSRNTMSRAGGANYVFATNDSVPPQHLITFFAPFFYGDPTRPDRESRFWETGTGYHEICGYAGVLPLVLLLFAFLPHNPQRKPEPFERREAGFFCLVALGALFFSLGRYNPLYVLLYYGLPGWKFFRVPGRLVLLFILGISVCSARGLGFWLGTDGRFLKETKAFKIAVVISALLVMATLVLAASQSSWLSLLREIEVERTVQEYGLPSGQRFAISRQLPMILFQTRLGWMLGSMMTGLTLLAAGWISLWAALKIRSSYRWVFPAAILLFDLLFFAHRFILTKAGEEWWKEYYPQTELISFLQKNAQGARVLCLDDAIGIQGQPYHPELRPNRLMHYGIESARGYDPIILQSYSRYVNLIYHRPADLPQGGVLLFPPIASETEVNYDLLNVRYIVTLYALPAPYRLAWEEKKSPVKVYENPRMRSRFFWENAADGDPIDIVSTTPNRVELRVKSSQEKRLIWSQNFYPGWQVWVDGAKKTVFPYQDTWISVTAPPGEHRILFAFYPQSLFLGGGISLFTIFSALAYLFLRKKFMRA